MRDSNIELMRILLMTMILLSHLITHGKYDFPDSTIVLTTQDAVILTFTRYHVNAFILISGFFGISLKFKKILSFLIMIFFWTMIGGCIDLLVFKTGAITNVVASLLNPFMSGWFLIEYFALMLYAPFLNKGLENLSIKQFTIILFLFLFFVYGVTPSIISSHAPHTFQFMAMYLIGRYLNRQQERINKIGQTPLLILNILLGGTLLFLVIMTSSKSELYLRLLSNQDPIVICMAIALFLLFRKMNIGAIPAINKISSGVIAAYLLTDCTLTGRMLDKVLYSYSCDKGLILCLMAFVMVLFFSTLEYLRKYFCRSIEDNLYKKIANRLSI